MIPAVPTSTASVNIHKNKRSSTIATYFQSSLTFTESSSIRVCSAIKRTQKHDRCSSVGQWRCEYPGFLMMGLLTRSGCVIGGGSTSRVDIDIVTSSDSIEIGPWIWQLPPKGPVVKLHSIREQIMQISGYASRHQDSPSKSEKVNKHWRGNNKNYFGPHVQGNQKSIQNQLNKRKIRKENHSSDSSKNTSNWYSNFWGLRFRESISTQNGFSLIFSLNTDIYWLSI